MKYLKSSAVSVTLVFGCCSLSFARDVENNPHFPVDKQSAVVKFSDLNLATASDAQILFQRIHRMASEVCKRQSDVRELNAIRDQKRCLDVSYKNALVAINRRTGIDIEGVGAGEPDGREVVSVK